MKKGLFMRKVLRVITVILLCLFYTIGCRVSESESSVSIGKNICEMDLYEDLFHEDIDEICMRETVDSAEWAVFSDNDLIEKWITYLENVELKYERSYKTESNGGGGKIVEIKTIENTYAFCFIELEGELKMLIDEKLYSLECDIEFPFKEIYDVAIERNSIKTPWD